MKQTEWNVSHRNCPINSWLQGIDLNLCGLFPAYIFKEYFLASKNESAAIIIKDYLRKYAQANSTEIARLLVHNEPVIFSDVEKTRHMLRYYRGTLGKFGRKNLCTSSYIPKIDIPDSVYTENIVYTLCPSDYPVIIGGDAHFPYHDKEAVELFFDEAFSIHAKTIVLLGDWMDMYQCSSFVKDPRAVRLPDEIILMQKFLEQIRKRFSKTKIVYKIGNHEDRLENYIKTKAPELFGLSAVSLESLLDFKKQNIILISSKQIIKVNDLFLLHGHEIGKGVSTPINSARNLYMKTKVSAVCGHYHQTSEYSEKDINGKIQTCYSIGCLCGLKPDYAPVNKWNLGFAEVYSDNGMFVVENKKIINYRII